MTKTATRNKKTAGPVTTTVDAPMVNAVVNDFNTNGNAALGEMLRIGQLKPSPTNPRKRFPESSIDELAISIKEQGVIEPLIVRRELDVVCHVNDVPQYMFEIVCGERRYRASKKADLDELPCIVRDLTDEQVLDIQIHENLHREDVHPMDEAYGYKFLQEKLGCDLKELAVRVGKSEKFVAGRLKLNALCLDAQDDIEAGHLPLVYALEIAKFPEDVQRAILDEGTYRRDSKWDSKRDRRVYFPIKENLQPWPAFVNFIQKNVLGLLSAAPFDIKATNLRKDGLACVACPDRSGANAGLFDEDQIGKKDACLNPLCFREKSAQLVVITRERIAHEANIKPKKVPTINFDLYSDRDGDLGRYSFTVVGKKPYKDYYGSSSEKTCDKSVTAVNVGDGQYAKTYEICLPSSKCKVHHKSTSSGSSSSTKSQKTIEAEQLQKRERKEELIDYHVGESVRRQVLRLAAEGFADKFSTSHDDTPMLDQLLTKLFEMSNSGSHSTTAELVVKSTIRQIMDEPDVLSFYTWASSEKIFATITPYSIKNKRIMLFLFIHGNTNCMYGDRFEPQDEIRAIAEEYGIDYRLLDARTRVVFAGEKHKKQIDLYKAYLTAVEAGNTDAVIPRPYAATYKPRTK